MARSRRRWTAVANFQPPISCPELRISGNEPARIDFDAPRQIEVDHFHPWLRMNSGPARKSAAFAHDHLRNAELHDRAAAEITRHQSRIENRVAKASDPTGVAQTIDFRMGHRVGVLHALGCDRPRATRRFARAPSRSEFLLRSNFSGPARWPPPSIPVRSYCLVRPQLTSCVLARQCS